MWIGYYAAACDWLWSQWCPVPLAQNVPIPSVCLPPEGQAPELGCLLRQCADDFPEGAGRAP